MEIRKKIIDKINRKYKKLKRKRLKENCKNKK